jgi:hypothetical protein
MWKVPSPLLSKRDSATGEAAVNEWALAIDKVATAAVGAC